jgi:hypothetical protein
MGLHQIKCFCPVKEIITRVKRQTAEWEKILDNKYMKNFWHPYHNGNADQEYEIPYYPIRMAIT